MAPINLVNLTAGTRKDLPYSGSIMTLSPTGSLYVSSSGRIAEYNSATLAEVATIPVIGTPGALKFSPDATRAFFINSTPQNVGRSIQTFRVAQRDITEWPPFDFNNPAPVFDELLVASNDRLFALQRSANTLWEITASPLGGVVTNIGGSVVTPHVYELPQKVEHHQRVDRFSHFGSHQFANQLRRTRERSIS